MKTLVFSFPQLWLTCSPWSLAPMSTLPRPHLCRKVVGSACSGQPGSPAGTETLPSQHHGMRMFRTGTKETRRPWVSPLWVSLYPSASWGSWLHSSLPSHAVCERQHLLCNAACWQGLLQLVWGLAQAPGQDVIS